MKTLAAALLAALSLSACGGPGVAPLSADDKLRTAVQSYSASFLGDDPAAAHARLSARCAAALPLGDLAIMTSQAHDLYGTAQMDRLEVAVHGNTGVASYTYDVPELDQTGERWVLEGSIWRNDDC